jgi:hypothetical protein
MARNAALTPRPPAAGRLDHDFYSHRTSAEEAAVRWPGGRVAAAFVLIHVEAFETDPPAGAVREPQLRGAFGSFHPDLRSHSVFEYGCRVGVFRLLDLLQPRGWQVAAAVNGLVAAEKPALLRALTERGVEILASGWSASRMVSGSMAADVESRDLARTLAAITAATGTTPAGYASQDYGWSMQTAALLEAAGIDHAVDWPNDERPYAFGPRRRIVMLPAAAELDDVQSMQARKVQGRDWEAALAAAFDWWQSDALVGSVLALPLHAAMAGVPWRTRILARALGDCDAGAFWQASAAAIAGRWRADRTGSAAGDRRTSP